MNVLFLTITRFNDVEDKGIYTDLMRKFRDEGHNVYVVTPLERRYKKSTSLRKQNGIHLLGVKTLNIQKTNIIEKGIGTLLVEYQFKRAILKYFNGIEFDLIIYSTPPITFTKAIKYLKEKYNAISYLLLKDIFPQNAVDLGMIKKNGFLYKMFRKKEIELYKISDYIGCMSPANVDFLLKHNNFIDPNKVEVNPNSLSKYEYKEIDRGDIRKKYSIPENSKVFVYGGNLGKPQGIDFLIECLKANINKENVYFLIAGSGTQYYNIKNFIDTSKPNNIQLFDYLPQKEYDDLVKACDVGLIFLNHRFTIPNYPSRLLACLENKMPILAVTDKNTDIGKIAEENGYGFWCESNSVEGFNKTLQKYIDMDDKELKRMGERGFDFLNNNYTSEISYNTILKHIKE